MTDLCTISSWSSLQRTIHTDHCNTRELSEGGIRVGLPAPGREIPGGFGGEACGGWGFGKGETSAGYNAIKSTLQNRWGFFLSRGTDRGHLKINCNTRRLATLGQRDFGNRTLVCFFPPLVNGWFIVVKDYFFPPPLWGSA